MNSLMQQMYMIPSIRKAVLEAFDPNHGNTPDDENMLHQIKVSVAK